MDEHDVRSLLFSIADAPEPLPVIDLERARRSGQRSIWIRRSAALTLAVAAVAAAVTIPRAIISGHAERSRLVCLRRPPHPRW